ncbi:Gmad2 immunoglobulin-like domain-containing protein [Neobacillus muris]|uniref:Gmad2 immunoglobulin-like domain-containing protein n=1 Tax=Neobacillus muris TaxID=2941334 RepID=UPI00203F0CF8|nr:Gmad2 immunoglobulin-like domain-containing protein [Neobacillus muris]
MRILLMSVLLFFFPLMVNADINGVKETEFRNMRVSGENGTYRVSGEVKWNDKGVFYTVEDGHNEYLREQRIWIKGKQVKWRPFSFTIQIPLVKLPENGTLMVYLYKRNQNGEIENEYPVVLERF